jgi:hypothetical protein
VFAGDRRGVGDAVVDEPAARHVPNPAANQSPIGHRNAEQAQRQGPQIQDDRRADADQACARDEFRGSVHARPYPKPEQG